MNATLFSFLSDSAYQFILPSYGFHNHLGDLAGLFFSSLLISSSPSILVVLLLIAGFIIMILSYSKSAFLGVMVIITILALIKKGRFLFVYFIVLLLSFCVVAIYTQELSVIPVVKSGQKIMKQVLHLNPKTILSDRDYYYPQVIQAWKTSPLEQLFFGYGSGNYIYPSIKTAASTDLTPMETHNIMLSVFIENGGLSGFWFLILCLLILYWGIKSKNESVYLFIFLLVNFQTDFTYAIPFFMGAFFFFAGQSIQIKKEGVPLKSPLFILPLCLMIVLSIISGLVFISTKKSKYDLDRQLNVALKNKEISEAQKIIEKLEIITPYEEGDLVTWSSHEESMGNIPEAVRLLEKLSVFSPRWHLLYLPHQLELQNKEGVDVKEYLQGKRSDFAKSPFTKKEKNDLNEICKKYADISCIESSK